MIPSPEEYDKYIEFLENKCSALENALRGALDIVYNVGLEPSDYMTDPLMIGKDEVSDN